MPDLSSPGLAARVRASANGDGRPPARARHSGPTAALALGALGVVFGDIGTSPLYALETVFAARDGAVRPDSVAIFGVISLVVWSVTIIVSVKYLALVMRAHNDGEGGIMALIALLQPVKLSDRRRKWVLLALGISGAALFYGDGMITPAISVMSAVEGLEVVAPSLAELVIPVTLAILTTLFAIQRFGTALVGRFFGPVMAVWFLTLAASGLGQVVEHPDVLGALSPHYAIAFVLERPGIAFIALGSIVLAVTGAEALYADMGHFGPRPIRFAWFALVFPALTLNYMGQAALIREDPMAIDDAFFLLMPEWARIPGVVLATLATVIAAQAVISGAFSVTRQAVQLGFLPRLNVRHTSRAAGQVYVPGINWGIFVAVVALVVGFGSSHDLAAAYGVAVTGTLAIDTVLFFVVVRLLWRKPLWLVVAGLAVFLLVDLAFLSANLAKIPDGGWFPLVIGAFVFTALSTWQNGRIQVTRRRSEQEGSLQRFVEQLRSGELKVERIPGTAVLLNANRDTTPLALRANVDFNHVMHETVVIVAVETTNTPHVPEEDRLTIDDLGHRDDGIAHLTARFGFHDSPDVPAALRLARERGLEFELDPDKAAYFVSRIKIVPTGAPGMRRWRKRLFNVMARNASDAVDFFHLPGDRTVTMGGHIEL